MRWAEYLANLSLTVSVVLSMHKNLVHDSHIRGVFSRPAILNDVKLADIDDEDCCRLVGQGTENLQKLSQRLNITNDLDRNVNLVWEVIRFEASNIAKGDLRAATIMASSVLSQNSLQDVIIDYVSSHLKTPLFQATQIRNLFGEICENHPNLICIIALDMMATVLRDTSCPNAVSALLFDKGFHSLVTYRFANILWYEGRDGLARFFQSLASKKFGSDIHPACRISMGCCIAGGTGVVIGETAVIGHSSYVGHGVTLGRENLRKESVIEPVD